MDLHVLPLCGANLVLGVQWFKSLGPVLTNYNFLSMNSFHDGRLVELKGDVESTLHLFTPPQLRYLVRKEGPRAYFHISVTQTKLPLTQITSTQLLLEKQALTTKFAFLFQPPHSLPPLRHTNHHIHLVSNAEPVNVRPYRYPCFQKHEIKAQVDSMLQKVLIQPSTSPFSSPVLLVKKDDYTWRFCVDYHALNAMIIKDHFPIPTINELLDELDGASWFSKLDLL